MGIDNRISIAVLTAGLILVVVAIALLCWVPPVSRDALIHHLAVPKLWIANQGMLELPHLSFSYYPMNLDLLYLIPLLFRNDIIPKYIHFFFGLLSAFLVFRYLRHRLRTVDALAGSLIFLSTPIIVKLGITAYVDLGLIFFSFAAIMFFFRWMAEEFSMRHLVACGIMCGLAIGTKYQGLIVLLLLTLFIPIVFIRSVTQTAKNQAKALVYSAMFIITALIIFSPWMLRNIVWTGNPVHPLFKSRLSKAAPLSDTSLAKTHSDSNQAVVPSKGRAWGQFNVRRYIYGESGWEILTIPIRVFFQGRDGHPKYFDGKLNPFLLLLPLLSFLGFRRDAAHIRTEKICLAAFSSLYLLIVYFQTDMRIRYIAPILPPLAILSIYGLSNLKNMILSQAPTKGRAFLKLIPPLILSGMLVLNGVYLLGQFSVVDPFTYISGQVDRDTYIARHRPEYGVIKYANNHLPKESRILAVFMGRRGYYSEREMIFDFSFASKSVKVTSDLDRLYRQFEERGITHLMIRNDLFNQWINSGALSDTQRGTLKEFLGNHTKLIHAEKGHGLYDLTAALDHLH